MSKCETLKELLEAFPDEATCIAHLEELRWAGGAVCPLCSGTKKIYNRKRIGIYKCAECKGEFSIRKGTIYEDSRLPLQKWFMAAWLLTSHQNGISSYQLKREIGVTQKTAWFMLGRLRKAAKSVHQNSPFVDGKVEAEAT